MLKLNYILFLVVLLGFSSCKTPYATVQPDSQEYFRPKKSVQLLRPKTLVGKETVALENKTEFEVVDQPVTLLKKPVKAMFIKKVNSKGKAKNSSTLIKKASKKTPPEKKKKNPFFNDQVLGGTGLLIVAIILGFLKLGTLSIIFGLGSMYFMYLGLKKYFRKNRRKQWFQNILK